MGSNLQPYEQFKEEISCRKCGNKGIALWENTGPRARSSETILVSLEGFFERLATKAPHKIETICRRCGDVQPL